MPRYLANVTIRPFAGADEAFAVDLATRVFSVYANDPRRAMRSMLARRDTETLVAELDSLPVGFVVLQYDKLDRDFGPWIRPTAAHLDAIAVRPDAHGRGVGRRLLESAEAAARKRPALSMSLATGQNNMPARHLFTGAGFVPLAVVERYYAGGQTAVLMHRTLID